MGDHLTTGQSVSDRGIYQSSCGCRTALTVLVGQTLPRCLGCDETVEWVLVQEIRPSTRPASQVPRKSSTTRLKAASVTPRQRLDSASGDDER
ncbi:MAG TPA: hypothetical protein VHE30_08830 [Polyangiaceae bacterium]|nr:hypothetical protein [Polyangiaceae bacterium]